MSHATRREVSLSAWDCSHVDAPRGLWLLFFSLLVVASAIWTFAVLADERSEGETHAFDHAILLPMRAPSDPTHS